MLIDDYQRYVLLSLFSMFSFLFVTVLFSCCSALNKDVSIAALMALVNNASLPNWRTSFEIVFICNKQ